VNYALSSSVILFKMILLNEVNDVKWIQLDQDKVLCCSVENTPMEVIRCHSNTETNVDICSLNGALKKMFELAKHFLLAVRQSPAKRKLTLQFLSAWHLVGQNFSNATRYLP